MVDLSAPATRSGRSAVAVALACGVGTLLAGLIRIGRSFGYDEGFTYVFFINGGSVRRALTTQIVFNNHPMFSAIQAVGWRLGFTGETVQRLGPVVCGAVAVGLIVWFTARHVGPMPAVGAGVVLAMNPVFFEQFRLLRGYALATAAVTAAAVALWISWSDHRRRWLVVQGICMVLAVTTHSFSALTLLMLAVASLALGRVRMAHFVTWSIAAVVALLIMYPVLDDMQRNAEARGSRYYSWFPRALAQALTGWVWPAVIVTSVLIAVGLFMIGRRSWRHVIALCSAGAVFVSAVLWLWQIAQPADLYFRFFMSVVPLLAVVAGFGLAALPRLAQPAVIVLLVVLLLPNVRDVVAVQPTVRDAAAVVDRAREEGFEVCGRHVEPLSVYTPPIRLVTISDDYGDCDVYVQMLSMLPEQRETVTAIFRNELPLGGGISVWAPQEVLDEILDDSG